MKIAKPMLMVTTPIGVFGSIYWAHRLAGGLVVLLVALFLMIAAAFAHLVMTAKRETRAQQAHPHDTEDPVTSLTTQPPSGR